MEVIVRHVNEWRPFIKNVIESKVDELKLLGYNGVNEDEVWECLLQKVWRKNKEKPLFQVVQDILHLNGSQYMSYLTVEMQQNNDLMAQIEALKNWEERK
ncbi:post-transcriptional regulator [Bacillaceae bacterium W0354]